MIMGSNGALEASRTSSSLSSPASAVHQPHITMAGHEMNNDMSDDNPDDLIPMTGTMHDDADNNGHPASVIALQKQDFLVSFLVDARGGSMKGCRYSGVKVMIPPKTAPQPMRVTCRYIRENALLHPPSLNEGEGR